MEKHAHVLGAWIRLSTFTSFIVWCVGVWHTYRIFQEIATFNMCMNGIVGVWNLYGKQHFLMAHTYARTLTLTLALVLAYINSILPLRGWPYKSPVPYECDLTTLFSIVYFDNVFLSLPFISRFCCRALLLQFVLSEPPSLLLTMSSLFIFHVKQPGRIAIVCMLFLCAIGSVLFYFIVKDIHMYIFIDRLSIYNLAHHSVLTFWMLIMM